MRKNKGDIRFDVEIGSKKPRDWTKKEFDSLDTFMRNRHEQRSDEDKLDYVLTGFKFAIRNYLGQAQPKKIVLLGDFITDVLTATDIGKGRFANYIDLTPQNFNKYLVGERKFNIEHARKLENMLKVNAETLLKVQLKNELLKAKTLHKGDYDNYDMRDLLRV